MPKESKQYDHFIKWDAQDEQDKEVSYTVHALVHLALDGRLELKILQVDKIVPYQTFKDLGMDGKDGVDPNQIIITNLKPPETY